MTVSENICPLCKTNNELEAIVCRHCGATLEDPFMDPGAKTKKTDISALVPASITDWSIDEAAVPDRGIAVYIADTFNPAYIDAREEFVIGRRVEKTSETEDRKSVV